MMEQYSYLPTFTLTCAEDQDVSPDANDIVILTRRRCPSAFKPLTMLSAPEALHHMEHSANIVPFRTRGEDLQVRPSSKLPLTEEALAKWMDERVDAVAPTAQKRMDDAAEMLKRIRTGD